MTVAISNGIVILLLFLQNTFAQQGVNSNVVNNAMPQPKATCNNIGVNSAQPSQQTNWQQTSNMQFAPNPYQSQNNQQPGGSPVKQHNQNLPDMVSAALQGLRLSPQKPGVNPTQSSGYKLTFDQASLQPNQPGQVSNNRQNFQYANQVQESPKPSFTFQFVPVPPQNIAPESQNSIPVQLLGNGQSQMASQMGPNYYTQNQPTTYGMSSQQVSTAQSSPITSGQSQPIVFSMNSQQPTGQGQPLFYTLQPAQPSSGGCQKTFQSAQPNIALDNPMALLMSQLQSPCANSDISSLLPILMSSKQEKSGGMKALLPLILNLLTDKGCGCPNCGCPCNNAEPTINGGYSNQMNYSQQGLTDTASISALSKNLVKNVEESSKVVVQEPKKYKTNVISEISEEASDEDDEYEYDDD